MLWISLQWLWLHPWSATVQWQQQSPQALSFFRKSEQWWLCCLGVWFTSVSSSHGCRQTGYAKVMLPVARKWRQDRIKVSRDRLCSSPLPALWHVAQCCLGGTSTGSEVQAVGSEGKEPHQQDCSSQLCDWATCAQSLKMCKGGCVYNCSAAAKQQA